MNENAGGRWAARALAVVVLGAACAGQPACAASRQDGGAAQFTMWMGIPGYSEDSSLQQLLREKLGFNFRIQWTQGDVMTAVNLKIASGGFEDVAGFWSDDLVRQALVRANAIQPVERFLAQPDRYPRLAGIPTDVRGYARSLDGQLWYVPSWFAQEMKDPWPGWAPDAFFVRTDTLAQLGMTTGDLATLAGLERYLRKVKASAVRDESGRPVIPMGFLKADNGNDDYRLLTAFGVSMAKGAGVEAVEKSGDSYVFDIDQPGYREGYAWMSRMYREGLIDPEVVTQKQELFREKAGRGAYAVMPTSMWNLNAKWEHLARPEHPPWYFEPIPDPRVPGVRRSGAMGVINPYPQWMIFISNRTQHLDEILRFLDWSLTPDPIRQQELNEGPLGINWFWVDKPLGEWDFTPAYAQIRNSSDPQVGAKLTPQLWMWGTYSNRWYPWFTNRVEGRLPAGFTKTRTFSQLISSFGMMRTIHSYDNVTATAGGLWERYALTLKAVREEYEARLIMARDEAEFRRVWEEYRGQLESRAHWTDLKAEWNRTYRVMLGQKGEY